MTYFITPVLGLTLPTPATAQTFETPVVNNNFILLENGIAADRTRLVSLETRDGTVADLAALLAVATPAQGWTRTVIEGSALFEWNGAWVQITTAFFSSPAGRDSAYAKAGGVYKVNGARVFIPGTGFANGVPQSQEYSTSPGLWRNITVGRIAINPGAAAGTGVSVLGSKINFVNNLSNLALFNIFTDEFDLYDVTIVWQSAGTGLTFIGNDDAGVADSGLIWASQVMIGAGAAASAQTSGLVVSSTIVGSGAINGNVRMRVAFARSLQAALVEFEGTVFSSSSLGSTFKGGARRNLSTKMGGLIFQFSAATSGYVIVEGVRA